MKNIICYLCFASVLLSFLCFKVSAENEYGFDTLRQEVTESLSDAMSSEVKEALRYMGIDSLDFEKVYNLSFSDVLSYFTPMIKEKAKGVGSGFCEMLVAVLLLCIITTVTENSTMNKALLLLGGAVMILLSFSHVSSILNSCVSVMKISGGFIFSFVPVLTLIISFSGNPASALAYNGFVMGITQVMSAFVNNGLTESLGAFFCLAVTFSLNESFNTGKLISVVNKAFSLLMGILGSLFSGILTIKNIMAVSVDSLSVRGVRFLLSSFIPIIGSSISEAYSSVLGSINLIKGSVVVIGILAVAIINLPVIAESLLWYFSFSVLSYISESASMGQISDLFRAVCCLIRILLILVVFEMFLLIISTGIMLTFRQ